MIKLKSFLLEEESSKLKEILRKGFIRLSSTTHLVNKQIETNLMPFLNSLDESEFRRRFGMPKKILGTGVFGVVFDIGGGKILKITLDFVEAPFLYQMKKHPVEGMVKIDRVFRFKFGSSDAFGIVRDDLKPITQTPYSSEASKVIMDMKQNLSVDYDDSIKREIKKALMSMYAIDPKWRGTHTENIGIQNGEIVLYDGFSKNVRYSPSIVPEIRL